MSKLYVGSEIGQLRRVLVHRPRRALTHLTPSNCHDLLFDDVLAVERAGKEHDVFTQTLRDQGVEVLLLTDLLADTLAVPEAKDWLLSRQVSDYRLGKTFANDVRCYLSDLPNLELAKILTGGLAYGEMPMKSSSMMQGMHSPADFIIEPLPNHLFTRDTSCWFTAVFLSTQWLNQLVNVKLTMFVLSTVGTQPSQAKTSSSTSATKKALTTTTQLSKAATYWLSVKAQFLSVCLSVQRLKVLNT